jgi:hypothetical protein
VRIDSGSIRGLSSFVLVRQDELSATPAYGIRSALVKSISQTFSMTGKSKMLIYPVQQRSFQLFTRPCRQYHIISVMHVNGTAQTQYTQNLPDTDHPVLSCSGL